MSKTETEYVLCIKCKQPLYNNLIEVDLGIDFELPYCMNVVCERYKLYTVEPES